jgi:hypothetical protein
MKTLSVFLTWSGDRSLRVAQAMQDWLPNVLQFADPWISVSDVDKGSKWQQSISGQLANASFGIICLTPENLASPWILFEAGALSKTVDSRVWTYLYDLGYTDVKDPLSQFQHTVATKEDTRKLIASINAAYGEGALDEARVRATSRNGGLNLIVNSLPSRLLPALFRQDLIALLDLLQQQKIKPLIAQRFPFAEARRAQELLGKGGVIGKIVLVHDASSLESGAA